MAPAWPCLIGCILLLSNASAFRNFNGFANFQPGQKLNTNSLQCGQTSNQKRTVVQSPSTVPSRCVYTFTAYSSKVCQLKIEMPEFRLQQPQQNVATDGVECADRFEANGITLCGNNDNQHLYVPFDASKTPSVTLAFTLPNQDAASRWRLVVTQLECPTESERKGLWQFSSGGGLKDIFAPKNSDWAMVAPPGCSQFFTERSGTFQSFNYNSGAGPYMTKLNYAICFQRQANDSAVELTFVDFMLPNEGANLGFDSDCHSLIQSAGKEDDYLMIPGAMVSGITTGSLHPTYFCGTSSKGKKAVYGAPGPFVIHFNSDALTSAQNVGFQIQYNVV